MKKLYTLLAAAMITATTFAQAPNKMSYQAVVRDALDVLVTNQAVGMQVSILQGSFTGTPVYVETHSPSTNINGLVSIEIGSGTVVSGIFNSVDWGNGPFFIKTETDPTGGTSYTITGTSQLLSVPYALRANVADSVVGGSAVGPQGPIGLTGATGPQGPIGLTGATGPQGATGLLSNGAAAGNTPYWDGSQWMVNNSNIHNNGAGVGIGTASPNASAKVEIASTTQGFLPPRMTTIQRDAISSPAAGLTIYNTTVNCLQWWNGTLWYDGCGNNAAPPTYPPGSVFCASGPTAIVDVTNPATGKTWMDRNLGATQAATSSTDAASYGDLYQWGRGNDGHQCRTSSTTTTLSSTDQPGNGNFILDTITPFDWRSPQNTNLWQGVNGVNNPCPSGYRLPTQTEIYAERLSWSTNNSAGAFASPLKWPKAGARGNGAGSLALLGTHGFYWSSSVDATYSRHLVFYSSDAFITLDDRADGYSVRCIKD